MGDQKEVFDSQNSDDDDVIEKEDNSKMDVSCDMDQDDVDEKDKTSEHSSNEVAVIKSILKKK